MAQSKRVIIVERNLPTPLAINACTILGVAFGTNFPQEIGEDLFDKDGGKYAGLPQFILPVLSARNHEMLNIKKEFEASDVSDKTILTFTEQAQTSQTYDLYKEKLEASNESSVKFCALFLAGKRKFIDKITKGLSLYPM